MKVALVFNPYQYQVYEENLRVVQKYFGTFPPLSLAWVAGILERHGHEAAIFDARSLGWSMDRTAEEVARFAPDFLGFTVTVYAYRDTLAWIRHLRARLGKPVLVGGFGVAAYPRETCAAPEVDFGFSGQVHESLPRFLAEWQGARAFSRVPGLIYKEGGEVLVNADPCERYDFDAFPAPARHLLPNEVYASFPTQRRNYTAMVTSMGCPYRCAFCTNARTPYTARSPETVLREIEECYERHGVREVDFFDYDLTIRPSRLAAICEGIVARGWDLTWACRARVDTVDEALLATMRRAGCTRVYYGIESGVQSVLDAVEKGITLDQVRRAVALTRRAGIETLGFFMIGNPGETRETVRKSIRFSLSLGLDYLMCCKVIPKPGTALYEDLVRRTGQDYWADLILGREEPRVLPRPWTSLTAEEVDRLARRMYLRFHLRPAYLWRAVRKVQSWGEFRRKLLALLDMTFTQEKGSVHHPDFDIYREPPADGPRA